MRTLLTVTALLAALLSAPAAAPPPASAGLSATERTVDLDYRFVVRDIPASSREVVAWIPMPPTNFHQRLIGYHVEGDYPHVVLAETEYGNRFLCFDLSDPASRSRGDPTIYVRFRVSRKAIQARDAHAAALLDSEEQLRRFLLPDRLVPIGGEIFEEAQRVAGGAAGPLEQARRLYDHIATTVHYDKSSQGWGRGDAVYACDVRRGNCTDFHSLFIAEARGLGIPARFIMGLSLPESATVGSIPGYHCWAEFYVRGVGWVPLDASEASQHPEKREALFGGLDANRIEFSVGRDIRLPQAKTGPVNYSIYPHVEVDSVAFQKIETAFSFQEQPSDVKAPVLKQELTYRAKLRKSR